MGGVNNTGQARNMATQEARQKMLITGAVRVEINYSQGLVQKENTLWYRWTAGGAPSIAQLAALTHEVELSVLPKLTALWAQNCTVRNITARYMGSTVGPAFIDPLTATYVGLRTGDPLPGNVAAALARRTPFVGRRNRGRMFAGSFSESDTNGDSIAGALRTLLLNLAASMLLDQLGGTFQAAVGSVKFGQILDITSVDFDNVLDSMRRRLTGRGT